MVDPPTSPRSDNPPVSDGGSPKTAAPSTAQVLVQLERILNSPLFASSESLRAFLRFTVERTLGGRGNELKEYLLGVEVFRRGVQFDPRLDSIVRVQGSKVRAKLREYYQTVGQDDPVSIELPKGAYAPVFGARQQNLTQTIEPAHSASAARSSTKSKRAYGLLLAVGSALAAIAAVVAYTTWQRSRSAFFEPKLEQLTYDSGLTTDPTISPDGKLVAYVSDRGGEDRLDLWVQPIHGGASLQLTRGPVNAREPDFSPDGTKIVFSSQQEAEGVYVVSVLGGEPRRLAPDGRRPRFSPDGRQILYWVGQDVYGALYVISADGGLPRRVNTEYHHATYPVWTPDGKHLLFWGYKTNDYGDADWWVVPIAGGNAVRTGLARILAQHQLEPDVRSRGDWTWFHNRLVLSARQSDSVNLWSVPISPETFQITGGPQRLTFGAGQDVLPSISPNGQMVFATRRNTMQIWSVLADVGRGLVRGGIEPLTTDTTDKAWPSISANGQYVAFTAVRGGRQEIWLRDLRTGQERTLTPSPATGIVPAITDDGSEVAFGPPFPRRREKVALYTARTENGLPEKICEDCGYPSSWSRDHSKILYGLSPRGDPSWLDRESGERHRFLRHPVYALWGSRFSPDDHWVAFTAVKQPGRSQVYIAPFPDGSDENAWIPVTDGVHGDDHLAWSGDGRLLYFVSDRDGWLCLWAQRLDPSMRPQGAALPMVHLHGTKRSIRNVTSNQFTLSASQDRLVFNLGELTGNVWTTQLAQR